jgi:hypothetical protein
MADLDSVTRYHVALARFRRQANRFAKGPVGSWRSPWKIISDDGDGQPSYVCDPGIAAARSELDAALLGLNEKQKEKHVLQLTPGQVKARDYERAVRQARKAGA